MYIFSVHGQGRLGKFDGKNMKTDFIEKMSGAHLLVVGEVGIDEYIWGDTKRISPEAPVPVVEVSAQTQKLGMAANVAHNITSLSGQVTLVSVCGKDREATELKKMINEAGITQSHFIEDATRPTLRKVRVIAQKQHVVRVDYERSHLLDEKIAKTLTEKVCDTLDSVDGVIVQDYGKGFWTEASMAFVKTARQKKKPVFVDPSRNTPLELYKGVTLLTPNMAEAESLTGLPPDRAPSSGLNMERLEKIAQKILNTTECTHSIVTCGEWGMISVSHDDKKIKRIPTFARQVFDVTGAGDTVIAVMSLMMVLGYSLSECMKVANAAAGIVVGQIGAACVKPQELKSELERLETLGLLK